MERTNRFWAGAMRVPRRAVSGSRQMNTSVARLTDTMYEDNLIHLNWWWREWNALARTLSRTYHFIRPGYQNQSSSDGGGMEIQAVHRDCAMAWAVLQPQNRGRGVGSRWYLCLCDFFASAPDGGSSVQTRRSIGKTRSEE